MKAGRNYDGARSSHWPLAILAVFFLTILVWGHRETKTQGASNPQKPIQHEVNVVIKLVQVYVTDKSGKPVQGLDRSDFVVFDNGEEKRITEFERHELTASIPNAAAPAEKEGASSPKTIAPVEKMNRKFFIFFDFAYNTPKGILKAKEAALHFIDTRLLSTDEIAVASYSAMRGIVLNEFLSFDHPKIRKTIINLDFGSLVTGQATDVEAEYYRQLENGKEKPSNEWERRESKNIARLYLENLTALAKALRYVPGQINIILFSSGIPASLLYGPGVAIDHELDETIQTDFILRQASYEMKRSINDANCAIYSFDTRGQEVDLFAKDAAAFVDHDRSSSILNRPNQNTVFKPTQITGERTLREVAQETGGKYYGNINEFQAGLEDLQKLTGTYYTLGYPITEKWDGDFHKIKVGVKKKGLDVHAQAGYFNPKPFKEYSDLEKQLHLFDLALSERPMLQNPQRFPLAPLAFAAGGQTHLQLLAKIPAEVIARFTGKNIEIISLVFDDHDKLSDLQRSTADLSRYREQAVILTAGTVLPSGAYVCRIVVRDLDTGAGAVASARIFVSNPASAGLSLFTPLLLTPVGNVAYLKPASRKAKDTEIWNKIYSYDQARYSPLINEVPAGMSKIYALLPGSKKGPAGEVSLKVFLIDTGAGKKFEIPLGASSSSWNENIGSRLIELDLPAVAPGKYSLYFYVQDPISKSSAYTQIPIIIQPNK